MFAFSSIKRVVLWYPMRTWHWTLPLNFCRKYSFSSRIISISDYILTHTNVTSLFLPFSDHIGEIGANNGNWKSNCNNTTHNGETINYTTTHCCWIHISISNCRKSCATPPKCWVCMLFWAGKQTGDTTLTINYTLKETWLAYIPFTIHPVLLPIVKIPSLAVEHGCGAHHDCKAYEQETGQENLLTGLKNSCHKLSVQQFESYVHG